MAKSAIDLLLDISRDQDLFEKFVKETETIDQLKALFGKEYEWPGDKEGQKILDARNGLRDDRGLSFGDPRVKY